MWRTKKMMLDIDPKQKKRKGAEYFELDSEIDDEWLKKHQQFLVEEQRTKIEKKFEKDNEKLKANKEKPLPQSELKERLQAVKELEAKFKKENKTNKVEAEGRGPTVEKLEAAVEKLEERIKTLQTQAEDREGNKEVALGTSKIVSHIVPGCSMPDWLMLCLELYRSPLDSGFLQEVRRTTGKAFPQDAAREVPLGYCLRGRSG